MMSEEEYKELLGYFTRFAEAQRKYEEECANEEMTASEWEELALYQKQSVIPAKDAQIKELKATIAQLTQQVASLQSTVEELQGTESAAWKQQVMDAQQAIVSLRVENNSLRSQLRNATSTAQYKELQIEYDKLSEQIGAIKAILGWDDDDADWDSGWGADSGLSEDDD